MCGVIGVSIKEVTADKIALVRRIFQQTMIRGKHATGLTYVSGGCLQTTKRNVPVDKFFQDFDLKDCVNEDGGMYLIGHIRYSTSDLRFPQPFSSENYSIAHNGVLSQEDASTWKYKTETTNDSEMILHSLEAGKEPLLDFRPSSMAVVTLSKEKRIVGFRNEARPLWQTLVGEDMFFTSTKDIAIRSGLRDPKKCEMYTLYSNDYEPRKLEVEDNVEDLQC